MANLKSVLNTRIRYDEQGRIVPAFTAAAIKKNVKLFDYEPAAYYYCGQWYIYEGDELWWYHRNHYGDPRRELCRWRLWRAEDGHLSVHQEDRVYSMSEYHECMEFEKLHGKSFKAGGIDFRMTDPMEYVGSNRTAVVRIHRKNRQWRIDVDEQVHFGDHLYDWVDLPNFDAAIQFIEKHPNWVNS